MKAPKARKVHESAIWTIWEIRWPSTAFKQGKVYRATTYPGSDLVYIETAATRRAVGGTIKMRLESVIRAAIAAA